MAEGAECVCVAEISIRAVGMPVFREAICLARSSSSRGIMQLSTTTIATFVVFVLTFVGEPFRITP